MTTTAEIEYRTEMRLAIGALRRYAAAYCTAADRRPMSPALAYAIWLAIPAVRYGSVGDEELDRQIHLDLIAAHEYGGHHGFAAEWIEDTADFIAGLYMIDREEKQRRAE